MLKDSPLAMQKNPPHNSAFLEETDSPDDPTLHVEYFPS